MKKILILVFLSLFLFNFVSAQPPFQQTSTGMIIAGPPFDVIKQNEDFRFHVHVINQTNVITNRTASCWLHLYNGSGYDITTAQTKMEFEDYTGLDFALTVNAGNFSRTGNYAYVITCNSTNQVAFVAGPLYVTPTGYLTSTPDSIMYGVYLLVFIISALFFLYLGYLFKHPGVKIFFMSLTAIIGIVIIALLSSSTTNFLYNFSNLVSVGSTYYVLLTILGIGAGIALVVWLVYYAFTMFYKSKNMVPED